jgi:hypothetical protein
MSNEFGGKNKNFLYVPISDIEQDFISRLVERNDICVVIHEWGFVENPRLTFGDKNLHVGFKMVFDRPEFPMPVHFFDLELKTRSGICLFRQKMSTEYGGEPLRVAQGVELDMVWDIAIRNIDPTLIKTLMPHTLGLTSRLQDTTSQEITVFGNMSLTQAQKNKLLDLHRREKNLPLVGAKIREQARKNK